MRSPMRTRSSRTIILALVGLGVAYVTARIVAPIWPGFCDNAIAGSECDADKLQSMYGYVLIVFGLAIGVFGPIVGSLIHLVLNGAEWETPRGKESVITNVPLLVGLVYMGLGIIALITA
jgi:hypothetical protein